MRKENLSVPMGDRRNRAQHGEPQEAGPCYEKEYPPRMAVVFEPDIKRLRAMASSLLDLCDLLEERLFDPRALERAGRQERTIQKHRVARGAKSYADVVALVMGDGPFSTDQAWSKVEPIIETEGEPRRSSMVRSLQNDDRFEEVKADEPGLWFRKVPDPEEEE